jgi:hypothetical protein
LQWLSIGIAILRDRRQQPVYPRWVGFVNIWLAVLFCPGNFIYFFRSGPLAWNGLLSWWATVVGFFVWLVVMIVMTFKAIAHQDAEAALPGGDVSDPRVQQALDQMADEIAALRAEVTPTPTPAR